MIRGAIQGNERVKAGRKVQGGGRKNGFKKRLRNARSTDGIKKILETVTRCESTTELKEGNVRA